MRHDSVYAAASTRTPEVFVVKFLEERAAGTWWLQEEVKEQAGLSQKSRTSVAEGSGN